MGTKNKPLSSRDKPKDPKGAKSKKDKGEGGGSPRVEITVTLSEGQAAKALKGARVITVQDLARQTGVKISAANAFLKNASEKGLVKKVGGYSGHHIYQPVSEPPSSPASS